MTNEIKEFRDGIFALRTRRFGTVAELMIEALYNFTEAQRRTPFELALAKLLKRGGGGQGTPALGRHLRSGEGVGATGILLHLRSGEGVGAQRSALPGHSRWRGKRQSRHKHSQKTHLKIILPYRIVLPPALCGWTCFRQVFWLVLSSRLLVPFLVGQWPGMRGKLVDTQLRAQFRIHTGFPFQDAGRYAGRSHRKPSQI